MGVSFFIAFFLGIAVASLTAVAVVLILTRRKRPEGETAAARRPGKVVWPFRKRAKESGERDDKPRVETPTEKKRKKPAEYTIQMSSVAHPEIKWLKPVEGELLIGRRDGCEVQLHDPSVSKEQCRIAEGRRGLVVINLSEVNETERNGQVVTGGQPLKEGDILTMGREQLRVDFIHSAHDAASEEPDSGFGYSSGSHSDMYADDFSETDFAPVRKPEDYETDRFW